MSECSRSDREDNPVPDVGGAVSAAEHMMTVNARKVILIGTAMFFLAFLVLLPFWHSLGENGHRVWLWTALAGSVLGVVALPLIRKHTNEGRLG